MQVGDVIARFKSDLTGFKKGLQTASGEVTSFGTKAKAGLTSVRNASLVVTGAIAGVAAASMKFGTVAGKYESIRDAFGSMTAGMGIGVDDFEKKVADASRNTLDRLTILQGGTRALSLIGKDAFSDFGNQFAQMAELSKKSARATGMDVTFMFDSLITGMSRESKMILDNLGITVDLTKAKKDYAEELGKGVDDLTITESKTAVLNHTLGKLEDTYGDVAVSGGGFSGAMSALKTEMTNAQIEIGTALLPVLNDLVRELTPLIKEYIPKFVEGISKGVKWFKELSPAGKKVVVVLVALAPILASISGAILLMWPLLSALPAIFGAIGAVITFLLSPIGLLVLAIAAIIAIGVLLYKNWDTIKAKAIELFDIVSAAITDFYENKIKPILEAVGAVFTWLWEAIIKPVIDRIVAAFKFWYEIIAWVWDNLLSPILYLIAAIFARIFYEIWNVIKKITEWIVNFLTEMWTKFWDWFKPYLEALGAFVGKIWDWLKQATQTAWNWIKEKIVEPISAAFNKVKEFVKKMYDSAVGKFDAMLIKVREVWQKLKDAIVKPFEEAKRKVEEIAQKIKDAAEKINPFHKESPSLVDNVQRGIKAIKSAYGELGAISPPSISGVGVGRGGDQILINMAGANITSPDVAEEYAEIIGDKIVRQLGRQVRV